MKQLVRLLRDGPSMYLYYIGISRSVDFMRRYTLLALLYAINAVCFGKLQKAIYKFHKYLHRAFVFKTKFGTFLGSTVNQRTVLLPEYEPETQAVINASVERTKREDRTLLNIGSHIGRFAIELAKVYGYESYCFEPNPPTYKTLVINTILSDVEDKVHTYNYALGNEEGELEFENVISNDGSSRILKEGDTRFDCSNTTTVPVKVYDRLNLNVKPSLVIIDVEGFEYNVLQGMKESLKIWHNIDVIVEIFENSPRKEAIINMMDRSRLRV